MKREEKGFVIVRSNDYVFERLDGYKSYGTQMKKDMLRIYGFDLVTFDGMTVEYHLNYNNK